MSEEEQSIFSKLLAKDKLIEELRALNKVLQDEKTSLEYMLMKSSEQIRKMQDESETQASNRSDIYREQEKLNADIELLKKQVQLEKMNSQNYENMINSLSQEIQKKNDYILKLSGSVNNAYNVIKIYQNFEKQKNELEESLKKQKKKLKSYKKEQEKTRQKLADYCDIQECNAGDIDITQKVGDLIQDIQNLKKEKLTLQDQILVCNSQSEKLKKECDEQKNIANALNKKMQYLKIENLSIKNKLEHANNDIRQLNSSQSQERQSTQKSVQNSNSFIQRTKSLDNSFSNYNLIQKYKTEGSDYIQKTDSESNYFSQGNIQGLKAKINSCSPNPFDNNNQNRNYLTIKNIRELYQNKHLNLMNQATDLFQTEKFRQKDCINQPDIKSILSLQQEVSGNVSRQKQNSQILNNSFNQSRQCNQHTKEYSSQLQSHTNQNFINNNTENNNSLNSKNVKSEDVVKQVLLNIEELILKEKVDKNQFKNEVESIIELELAQDDKVMLNSLNQIIKDVTDLQVWESFNVALLVQKLRSLIQIILAKLNKTLKINLQLQQLISNNNLTHPNNEVSLIEKDMLSGFSQIIEQVGGFKEEDLSDDQKSRKIQLSLNTNHISIIKELEEPQTSKLTDETILIDKLGKEQDFQKYGTKLIQQDDIKHLLTELQELNQSTDYNQYVQFFMNRKRSQSKQKLLQAKQNEQNQANLQVNQEKVTKVNQLTTKNDKVTQTDSVICQCVINQNQNKIEDQINNDGESYVNKLKKQMQLQFSKKVKDLEQVLLLIKSFLNEEKENVFNSNTNSEAYVINNQMQERLQKIYHSNPNLKPFIQNFIEKISALKENNQQLQLEIKKYQLSNKHIKQLR
ncbi:hypothetical protein ABPG74_007355 [Tetrahymena malaccensis]